MTQRPLVAKALARSQVGAAALFVALAGMGPAQAATQAQPEVQSRSAPILTIKGKRFRDLDRDGRLTPYEDWRLSPDVRARDLVSRMTLEEKAGTLVHSGLRTRDPAGMGSQYDIEAMAPKIETSLITAFGTRAEGPPEVLAAQHNELQALAERTRLGVPLTLSSDPRHHFFSVIGAQNTAAHFSQWPDAPGLAAIDDPAVTRRFGDIARQEYRAIGLQMTLSPQADLATEPRWARVIGTFGEDPDRVGRQVAAYVEGFQHGRNGVQRDGVITVVKHWVGYGAAKDGHDSHNAFGRYADLTGGHLREHLRPFEYAFRVNAAAVMPTYSILQGVNVDGVPVEPVGAGFSRQLITDLLRKRHHFKGLVLSDSAITEDCVQTCLGEPGAPNQPPQIAMPWGVETLTRTQRTAKALNAGVDQILGLDEPKVVVQAVRDGLVPQSRIDDAARRVLALKFAVGLFENPYVDPEAAKRIVGSPQFRAAAMDAQRRAFVLLEDKGGVQPLRPGAKVFLYGVNPDVARQRGLVVVDSLDDASVAIVRGGAPFQTLYPNFFISRFQHAGDLDFKAGSPVLEVIAKAAAKVPVIVDINLDRPAILTNVREKAAVLMVDFGASDEALLDNLLSGQKPRGRLPYELPSSMEAVRAQRSDAPHDSHQPLYPIGYRFGG